MKILLVPTLLFGIIIYGCGSNNKTALSSLKPKCIDSLITTAAAQQAANAPQSVTQYRYKGRIVYYVVSPCCDQYNTAYDDQCKVLGSPDGGITGKGDGTLPDFFTETTDKKVIREK
jgi:hypothetical protein